MTDVLRRAKLDIERLKKKERRQRRMRCGGDSIQLNSVRIFCFSFIRRLAIEPIVGLLLLSPLAFPSTEELSGLPESINI